MAAKVVKVQSVESKHKKLSKRELYAEVCYYYPRYSLKEVQRLPGRDVRLLLKKARQLEAVRMYNLTAIAAAPHSEKGRSVKKLLTEFDRMAKE